MGENSKYYLFLNISFNNEEGEFKMSIDKNTALHFKESLELKPFKEIRAKSYSYFFSGVAVDKRNKEYYVYVEIRSGKMRKKVKTKCSQLFCRNILWINETNTFAEYYKHLIKVRSCQE